MVVIQRYTLTSDFSDFPGSDHSKKYVFFFFALWWGLQYLYKCCINKFYIVILIYATWYTDHILSYYYQTKIRIFLPACNKVNLTNTWLWWREKCENVSLSRVWLSVTPWTVVRPAPLSMEFSRQEYWSGLSFPFPGDFPTSGLEPRSSTLQAGSLLSHQGSAAFMIRCSKSWCLKSSNSLNGPVNAALALTTTRCQ